MIELRYCEKPIFTKDGEGMNSFFAKQPIIDLNGNTYGYEMLYRTAPKIPFYDGDDGDKSSADVINNLFFGDEDREFLNNKRAFLNFTENLLLQKTALLLPRDQIVVEVLENVAASREILDCCRELMENGYIIALDDYTYTPDTAPLLDYCQIVKIDFRNSKKDIELTAAQCRSKKKTLLAEKIETDEEAEYAKSLGCTLMQGFYFAKPLVVKGSAYSPMALTFSKLINELRSPDVDMDNLADVISSDPFMTAKLLRLVNALRGDMANRISTVKQALLMLGVKKLTEWIYIVGLQSLSPKGPDERVRVALFRATFCRIVSIMILDEFSFDDEMYLMGLMSVVVDLNDKESMTAMRLSNNIIDGLSSMSGVYGDTFNFVLDCEQANWAGVDKFVTTYNLDGKEVLKKYIECMNKVQMMCFLAA